MAGDDRNTSSNNNNKLDGGSDFDRLVGGGGDGGDDGNDDAARSWADLLGIVEPLDDDIGDIIIGDNNRNNRNKEDESNSPRDDEPAATSAATSAAATAAARRFPLDGHCTGIPTPRSNDVLCGRGAAARNHVGNKHYLALVDRRKEAYHSAFRRDEKCWICEEIVREIHCLDPPGRFLRQDDKGTGLWHVVEKDFAVDKTMRALQGRPAAAVNAAKKRGRDDDDDDDAVAVAVRTIPATIASRRLADAAALTSSFYFLLLESCFFCYLFATALALPRSKKRIVVLQLHPHDFIKQRGGESIVIVDCFFGLM
jgi:hypothetical protein